MMSHSLVTRDDVAALMRAVFEPVRERMAPSGARITLAGPNDPAMQNGGALPRTAEIEAMLRPLWGPASLAAGGGRFDHWDRVREAIAAGTDPAHPDYWGAPAEFDQRLVEMSTLGAGLLLAPHELWEPFDRFEQQRLAAWLRLSESTGHRDNNWWFFRVMVQLGLRRVGLAIDADAERHALDRIDACYLDDGWYSDVPDRPRRPQVDWYSAHVFHTFGLLYAWSDVGDSRRSEIFRERAALFAPQLRDWFAPGGAPLPYGRSLTYRAAPAAFWPMLAAAGVDVLPITDLKGLSMRALRHWQPVLDQPGHLLSPGYHQALPKMVERYITPGSPYWTCIAFVSLLMPEDHPFWRADEQQPSPSARVAIQRTPGMVVSTDGEQVLALNSRQSSGHPSGGIAKYCRLAYSSLFGFSYDSIDDGVLVVDSTLTVTTSDGRTVVRSDPSDFRIVGDALVSTWTPGHGIRVHTVMQGCAPWHWRAHLVETNHPLVLREWGFSVSADDAEVTIVDGAAMSVDVVTPLQRSGLVRVGSAAGMAGAYSGESGTNLLSKSPLTPMVEHHFAKGSHRVHTMVFGAGAAHAGAWAAQPVPDWEELDLLLRHQRRRVNAKAMRRRFGAVGHARRLVAVLRKVLHG